MPDLKPDNASFNPYAAPRAAVADVYGNEGTTQPVRLFSARGRMGRLRYLGWNGAFSAAAFLLIFIVLITRVGTGIFGIRSRVDFMHTLVGAGSVRIGLVVIIFAGWFTMLTLMRIQRSHDMGWSGWSVLGMHAVMVAGGVLAGLVLPSNPVSGRIIGFAISLVP